MAARWAVVSGAGLAWGIDNNLTRKLSSADSVKLAMIKGLGAGIVGFLGYGVSLVLFVLGLTHLGTARTGAYFSLAPFVDAILAVVLLKDNISLQLITAGVFIALSLWLHLTERHEHLHAQGPVEHEHRHFPDLHQRHGHE